MELSRRILAQVGSRVYGEAMLSAPFFANLAPKYLKSSDKKTVKSNYHQNKLYLKDVFFLFWHISTDKSTWWMPKNIITNHFY